MRKLTDPQPTYTVPVNIPDTDEDRPVGDILVSPKVQNALPLSVDGG